ncbi:MAG TPA: hypothetical protein VLE46_00850 [Nitrospira sp.]|nr:hypothetical protein [Nitrospira sp.]
MTRCDPDVRLGSAPAYKEVLTGEYQAGYGGFGEELTIDEGHSDKEKQMWNEWCTVDRVEIEGDNPRATRDAECRIPEEDWDAVWYDVKVKGENPYEFKDEAIEWIRFELSKLIEQSVHWWLEVDDPFEGDFRTDDQDFLDSGHNDNDTDWIRQIIVDNTLYLTGVVVVISILFVAGRMVLQRNAQPVREVLRAMMILVIVSVSGIWFIKTLLQASSAFSDYFVLNSLDHLGFHPPPAEDEAAWANYSKPCDLLAESIRTIPTEFENMNFFLFLLCAVFLLVGALILYMYMIMRVFAITLLSGLMPLAAAGTATEAGKDWFSKNVSYILAFILIKPAATIVFVVAIRMASGQSYASGAEQITACAFLFMGTVLLPAMTRLAFPFVSAAAQGDRAAKQLAAGPVAVGAKVVGGTTSSLMKGLNPMKKKR